MSTSWSTFLGHKVVADSAAKVPRLASRARRQLGEAGPLGVTVALEFDAFLGELAALPGDGSTVCELLMRRHALVQASKHAAPWVQRHGDRLEVGAPRGTLLYDPFELDVHVERHLFRLRALQSIARAIRRVGVSV